MIIYNWATYISTYSKEKKLHFIVTKNRIKEEMKKKKRFEYDVICVKLGTPK